MVTDRTNCPGIDRTEFARTGPARFGPAKILTLAIIASSMESPALADTAGAQANPPPALSSAAAAPIPDAMRFITSAQTSLGTGTDLTVGVIYLGGLRMTLPFVQVDQAAGRNFGIQAAYFFAIRNRSGSPDLRSHFLRLGATYKVTKGRLTFDDRLLYETVINESGADTHRIRNLTRLSYNLAPASHIQPRLFGYAEPIWDRRLGGISRVDVAAGFGATFRGIWRMDVYALRQEILAPSQSTVKAIVVQTTIRLGRRPGRK